MALIHWSWLLESFWRRVHTVQGAAGRRIAGRDGPAQVAARRRPQILLLACASSAPCGLCADLADGSGARHRVCAVMIKDFRPTAVLMTS